MPGMTKLLALTCLLALSSCGGSDPAPGPSKALFSVWTADDNTDIIDLRGGTFGSGQTFVYQLTSGEICACNAAFGGSESSATAVLTGCAYVSGGGGDPGCAALSRSYTLANVAAKLTLCGATCDGYH